MEGKKRGFVLYFDNCHQLMRLPDGEFAPLMRMVMEYAERLADGKEEEKWLAERYRALSSAAGMALGFTVENLRRDHQGYLASSARRAAHGRRQQSDGSGIDPEMAKYFRALARDRKRKEMEDDAWKYVK